MLFPSVIGWGKERLSFSDSSLERRKSSRHPENAVHQGSLAESNFLIPLPSRVLPIGRPIAAARYAVSAEIAKRRYRAGQHIRRFHSSRTRRRARRELKSRADNVSTPRRGQSRKMGSCRSCLHGASRWQLIVAVRLEAEGCGEHWPVHVDIQGGTWSADIEVQAAKSGM
jgi:hypothetical protein